ncbi:uncharacterized protein CXQ87_002511 [Candidozyma duobushaemuli]|uniref:Upf1 domain-containing protein n=1 Tax=Candidozyma duobushaemuli TaxID=1231522 RepID=A0A2V1A8V2_9ASCO|nr:uncharacterized protein CXQ87_002511 [[Candida] duobushaemulonis]PVH14378.1 hypothetical protein CXQ87_002511 [[Candida] duobushaemulonis]
MDQLQVDSPESAPTGPGCAYCGLASPQCIAKCESCSRWFCNGKSHSAGSHLVAHLVLSKHHVVSLHEESALGAETLECYNCGSKNIFSLGFVSAKHDSVVVILCRMPCAQSRDINWETNEWQALISDRQLLPWVAEVPEAVRKVSHDQITKLEAQWRVNRDATIEDIDRVDAEADELMPVLLRYQDAYQYQNAFAPLVEAEAICDKNLKESQALEHISVTWSTSHNNNTVASFALSTHEKSNLVVAVGDEIILHHHDGGFTEDTWSGKGFIVSLPSARSEEFSLELLPGNPEAPVHATTGFTAEFVWKGTSYSRMQKALRVFATEEESVSSFIYHKLLGHEVVPVVFSTKAPKQLSVKRLARLNDSQANAVATVLQRPLSLIQGPPGTGKTVTSATIIYHLVRLHKHKVLVCAPSNVAVDHLAHKLDTIGIKVVRLTARSREDVDSSVSELALHQQIERKAPPKVKRLMKLKRDGEKLSEGKEKLILNTTRKIETDIIQNAEVVCCTCVGAGDFRLNGFNFRSVLIDESTQATEPEVLIPIVKGAKQVILVGDHQQLGPVIIDKKAGEAGLKQSLFERLIALGHSPIRLEVQYRMNPALSEFSSNMFYEGSLQNGVNSAERAWRGSTFPWPVPDCPMMFWANYGKEEISGSGISYLNRVEAMNVEKIITRLFKDGVRPEQIGVVTPYEGQRAYIVQYMSINSSLVDRRAQYADVEVASVDAFQGREKDFIILSCVRANEDRAIGFLKDPRRMNVALTRAKYGLVILGNPRSLSKDNLWNYLLIHFRERGCLVDGPLDNLQMSMVPLGNPNEKKQRQEMPRAAAQEFDTQSMLSYVEESGALDDEQKWPRLNGDLDEDMRKAAEMFAQRSKLSHSDVKLILWLIVQIKPFKYVGDRTLSQSRKWDLIQQRFEHERMKVSSNHVVPTVRTLQRQMAAALRKAKNRKLASDYKPYAVFEMLHPRSSLPDLELAVLELHDLSEAYKSGQMVGPLPSHVKEEVDPHLGDFKRRRSSAASQLSSSSAYSGYSSQISTERLESSSISEDPTTVGLLRNIMSENRRFHDEVVHMMRRHAAVMNSQLQKLTELMERPEHSPSPAGSDHMEAEIEGTQPITEKTETTETTEKAEVASQKPDNVPVKEEKVSSLREVLNW